MSAEAKLREIATELADRHVNRILALEKEMLEIERRKTEVQSKLDAANLANDRLADYQIKVGTDCPRCAIDLGRRIPLNPIPSDERFVDKFRCRVCGLEIDLPA